jgi:hypothetical protein
VKHLGPLGFFLGVEVVSYIGAFLLAEGHYIVNILIRINPSLAQLQWLPQPLS